MPAPTIDIGILTIRDDEFKAVLSVFPSNPSVYRGRHREYALRTAEGGQGVTYRLALLRQIEQGNGEAQEAARDMIDDLQPSLVLVVGIAGGIPSDDITLGDVVLSTRIVDFSIEARKFKEATTYNVGGGPIFKSIATGIANLSARESDLGTWWDALPEKPKVSWSGRRQFYGPAKWQRNVKEKLRVHYGPNAQGKPPIFAAGTIASSDRLVKDPKLLFPWITTTSSLQAIEMESAGVHRATRDRTPMLAIRGISDIVGLKRNDAWTKYACASAAAFSRAYLHTRPVELRTPPSNDTEKRGSTAAGSVTERVLPKSLEFEEAFANLISVRHFPEKIYVGPATCKSFKHGWAVLRGGKGGQTSYVPGCWMLHEGRLYSLVDPEESRLAKIVDIGGIEAHASKEWAFAVDVDRRRLFVGLLNSALRDDLWSIGVRYHSDADVYAFIGHPDNPPRRFKYPNLKVRSTMTVVSHYEHTSRAGKKYKFLRHNAFQGRFRLLGGAWHLEITPTYRFTRDGKSQDKYHEQQLSGIKRLERNRSVLSQLLLWQAVLRAPWPRADRPRLLEFDPLVSFDFTPTVDDSGLTAIDAAPLIPQLIDKEVEE